MQRFGTRTLETAWLRRRRPCGGGCFHYYRSVGVRCMSGQAEDDRHMAAVQTLRSVAQSLPPAGITAGHLQALLEDEYPLFSPSAVDALTLRDAVQKFPELFRVEPAARGSWLVKPALPAGEAAQGTHAAEKGKGAQDASEAYRRIVQYCNAQVAARAGQGGASGEGGSAASFVPLERVLRALRLSDVSVVDELCAKASQELEVRVCLQVRPRRAARCAILFIDGTALAVETVRAMCAELNIVQEGSTMYVARHTTRPAAHTSASAAETVLQAMPQASIVSVPVSVPLSVAVERQAHALRLTMPAVLQDIVYLCGDAQWAHYRDVVAPCNAFPDADVYVCSPGRAELVAAKRVLAFAPH